MTKITFAIKNQYIETLIKMIELNNDHYWLDAFLNLRRGGMLPGGGAGSLNDWGPSYSGIKADAWYGRLYTILRELFDQEQLPEYLAEPSRLVKANQTQVIRCLTCQKSHQHPAIFEAFLAVKFYNKVLPTFTTGNKLSDILKPELSFNSPDVLNYRSALLKAYAGCGITVYDFLFGDYICPHCNDLKPETVHDRYQVENDIPEMLYLKRLPI
ncbi:hypothetical protein Mucpa_2244 [Mucilaginibacter paludis DSM 18603]|uniref:Uncharacterized protein n=2 Tax=Mucilaginibacter TaxID=423349 RepID=H1YGU8_9SPHI|nr:hypothetical protein Mucpa_2244 [Mucilaginibacter paludis DSM 18603]